MQIPGSQSEVLRKGGAFKNTLKYMCKTDAPFKLFLILNLYFVPPKELASQNVQCLFLNQITRMYL